MDATRASLSLESSKKIGCDSIYPSIRALLPEGIFQKLGREFAMIEEQFIGGVIRLDRLLDRQLGNWNEETFEALGTVE